MPFTYKARSYLHIDAPMGRVAATALATNEELVARHGFLPFISHTVVTRKIKRREGGGVEKRQPKSREILYAGHQDSQIFSRYSQVIQEFYESVVRRDGLDHVVTAFRRIRRAHNGTQVSWKNTHFAEEAFEFIRNHGPCSALAMDFSDFFGNLDHRLLKKSWCRLLQCEQLPLDHYKVFRAITKHAKVEREALYSALNIDPEHPRRGGRVRLCSVEQLRDLVRESGLIQVNRSGRGIPQGSPISAILSNIYMLEFDRVIHEFAEKRGGFYRRYCDDILLVMPTVELRQEAETLIRHWGAALRLPVNPDKTERFDFVMVDGRLTTPKPLQYLGFTFDGRHKRIRPASVARYYKKMRAGVGRAKAIRYRADREVGRPYTTWLRRKKLYLHYSYLGRHNFLAYAFDAARIMNDSGIKKQVKKHWNRLQEEIGEPRAS